MQYVVSYRNLQHPRGPFKSLLAAKQFASRHSYYDRGDVTVVDAESGIPVCWRELRSAPGRWRECK